MIYIIFMGFFGSLINALIAFLQAFQKKPETTPSEPTNSTTSGSVVTPPASETPSQIIAATGAITAIYTGDADGTVAPIATSLDVTRKQQVMVNLRVDDKDVVYLLKTYDQQPNSNEYVLTNFQSICSETNLGKSAAYFIGYPGTNGWTLGRHSLKILLVDAQSNTVLDSRFCDLNVSMPGDDA